MTAPKAWRFDGEMAEIAASFAAHDLPTGFGDATRDVFGRMADFKGIDDATLDAMLDAMTSVARPASQTGGAGVREFDRSRCEPRKQCGWPRTSTTRPPGPACPSSHETLTHRIGSSRNSGQVLCSTFSRKTRGL